MTVSYSNDGSRFTVKDSSGNVTGTYDAKTGAGLAGTQGSSNLGVSNARTVTNNKGQTTTQFDQGNATYNVAPGSIFDPLSPNYNAIVANSGGKIALSDLDHSSANGLSAAYNSGHGANSTSGIAVNSTMANGGLSGGGFSGTSGSPSYGTLSTPSSVSSQSLINQLKQAQIDAAVSALGKSRDASLSNLNAENATIEPQYYASRNAASTQNQLQAKNFAEYLSQRNGGNADQGVANQSQIANSVALQGSLGALDSSEQAANNDIARRTTDIGNAYNSDVASANAGANAASLQNTINQSNLDRTFNAQQIAAAQQLAIQQAGLTGIYNGQSTLAATQAAQQLALQQAGLTGVYNGTQTMAGKQSDASINASNASTEYQRLVNANYPAEQAAKMAQAAATLTGANLQNDYQTLVNVGYPAQQAMQLATAQANIDQGNRQLDISQQNANKTSSGGSASNLSAVKYQNEQNSNQSMASSMQGLQNMANNGSTRSEILKFINSNASDLQANGVPVQDLYKWASTNFTWDKDSSGSWYNTAGN